MVRSAAELRVSNHGKREPGAILRDTRNADALGFLRMRALVCCVAPIPSPHGEERSEAARLEPWPGARAELGAILRDTRNADALRAPQDEGPGLLRGADPLTSW